MDKMKKSVLKGFTLVELLVVMAIFSVLMAAALALTTPVSRMYKHTALAEKTYSYSHNIQEYLQGALEYADSLYVLTGDNLSEYSSMQELAEKFRKEHYDNVVKSDDGTSIRGVRGKIYILRLLNKAATLPDGTTAPAGQITLTEYVFDNAEAAGNEIIDVVPERAVLNPAFFSAPDSSYSFSYALGHSQLVSVPTPTAGDQNETYKAIKQDFDDTEDVPQRDDLSIEIVLDKAASQQGYVDVDHYRAFRDPVAVQIANLPLTNINTPSDSRSNLDAGVSRPMIGDDGKVKMQSTVSNPTIPESGWSFWTEKVNPKIDFNNDIYFVYAYGDELR